MNKAKGNFFISNRLTTTNENENKAQAECLGDVVFNSIIFPRQLIDEAKAVFTSAFEKEFTDEECAIALYKYAKLEMLVREIKAKNEERNAVKITANNKPKEEQQK
ncbi:MAG: hypothetical protein FWG57_00590 [Endomicrobia bacterium]|nr:hypothetical protein [Endomicrobiia bacterium]